MRIVGLSLLALVLLVHPTHADTLYEYTGNPFTSWTGGVCAGDCAIAIVVLPSVPLAPNQGPQPGGGILTSGLFTITDGSTTLSNRTIRQGEAWIYQTDASGLPSEWNIWIEDQSNPGGGVARGLSSILCLHNGGGCSIAETDFITLRNTNGVVTYHAQNTGNAGTWRILVAEPSSLVLVAASLAGLWGTRRLLRV